MIFPALVIFPQTDSREYPMWFLHPADNQNVYCGYGYNRYSALEDVVSMTSLFNECIVNGTLNMYTDETSDEMYKDSDYYYYFDPDNKVVDEDKLFPIDKFFINLVHNQYIQAFAEDSNYVLTQNGDSEHTDPEWIKSSFFIEDDYFYGVGQFTSIGNKIDAWKTAEERGIFNIILNNSFQIFKVKHTADFYDDDSIVFDEIIAYKFRYILRGIEIMERYPDYKNDLFYVLVRIKKANVKAGF